MSKPDVVLCSPVRTAIGASGAVLTTYRDSAEKSGKAREFTDPVFTLEYAREAFVRCSLEGATVGGF